MKQNLTKNQNIVFSEINSFIQQKGIAPTFSELKNKLMNHGLKLKSINSITQYLNILENKGYLKKNSCKRGIKLLKKAREDFIEIPFLGNADCGEPLSFTDDCPEDQITLSSKYLEKSFEYFFVRATGDSMNKDKINDGDYVLVKRFKGEAEDGDRVVASVNGLGTIKKLKKNKKTIALTPNSTNPQHTPIILHPEDETYICGKVDRVFNLSDEKNNTLE